MEFIVDIQGFTSNGEFIPKEIAILSKSGNKLQHYILEPPVSWNDLSKACKKEANWLLRHYHGLYWDSGCGKFKETLALVTDILSPASKIYVKGLRKKKYLENQINLPTSVEVIDLIQYPSLKTANFTHFTCFEHSSPYMCALRNVFVIQNWLNILHGKHV